MIQDEIERFPLVSCIMPTYNRPKYLQRSIQMFLEQDYPNKELIIIDDSDIKNTQMKLTEHINVRYYFYKTKYNVGKKRNLALTKSNGKIFIFWDDDDIYSKDRISYQVKDIIANKCDLTVFNQVIYYLENEGKFYKSISRKVHNDLWYNGYICGTMACKKSIWNKIKFDNVNIAEDARFIMKLKGYKIKSLKNNNKYLYTRHKSNTFRFNLKNKKLFKEIQM